MQEVLFTNKTDKAFECKWNGDTRLFKPGDSRWYEEGIARHYAFKLAERELLKNKAHEKLLKVHVEEKAVEYLGEAEDSDGEGSIINKNKEGKDLTSEVFKHNSETPSTEEEVEEEEEEEFPDLKEEVSEHADATTKPKKDNRRQA